LHLEGVTILVVFSLPHKLRIERGVAGVEQARINDGLGLALIVRYEVAQLFRRDIPTPIFVAYGVNLDLLLSGHLFALEEFNHQTKHAFEFIIAPTTAVARAAQLRGKDIF